MRTVDIPTVRTGLIHQVCGPRSAARTPGGGRKGCVDTGQSIERGQARWSAIVDSSFGHGHGQRLVRRDGLAVGQWYFHPRYRSGVEDAGLLEGGGDQRVELDVDDVEVGVGGLVEPQDYLVSCRRRNPSGIARPLGTRTA